MVFNKVLIIPIIAWIVLTVKLTTGYEFPSEWADLTADAIIAIIGIAGHFIHPKKPLN